MKDNNCSGLGIVGIIFLLLVVTGGLNKCQNGSDPKTSAMEYCAKHDCSELVR